MSQVHDRASFTEATYGSAAEHVTIRAFRAVDDKERCVRFLLEHIRVLENIGVVSVIKPDVSWCVDPKVIVVVAEHEQLGMVAGIRLHVATEKGTLPMERVLKHFDPSISEVLSQLASFGTAEVAGLWNAHRYAGRGIPKLLIESVVSIANQVEVSTLVTFIAEYVAPYARDCGFVMMEELHSAGNFVYPVPSIHTHAMLLPDAISLYTAEQRQRQRLMSLRVRPSQLRPECPKKTELEVSYELVVEPGMAKYYGRVDRWRRSQAA